MVFPDTVLRSVKEAIKSSERLPSSTTYAVFELDFQGGQSNVRPPVVEITTVDTIRSTSMNTDFTGYATDSDDNHIGRIYRAGFEMPIEINVITAEGDGHDPSEIANEIRFALYQYEDRNEGTALPDPDTSGTIDDVTRFQLDAEEPSNNLNMTHTLRGRQEAATVWFEEVIDTSQEYGAKDYVDTVNVPSAGEWVDGSSIDIIFDASPNTTSAADSY